uniref:Metallo-beta-lactamase domain-containing protein n=1 Tax=Kalanchoe fedtschenkoi TaxID=63787 RepID=A0A7N0T539_KALFE
MAPGVMIATATLPSLSAISSRSATVMVGGSFGKFGVDVRGVFGRKAVRGCGGCWCYGGGSEKRRRRAQNVDGDLFVDCACIDCDTCRWMAPHVFKRVDGMAAVSKQPESKEEQLSALQALISCPTSSIHTKELARDIAQVHNTFPIAIDSEKIPGVYHCGYHSKFSYGAASYLIVHPEGNILVDSPRYAKNLAQNIEMLGGARYMFLTHKDDVADHEKWAKRFSCERILHTTEIQECTADVEWKLEGDGPWSLCHDIDLIHTPGHSEGSVCLFYKSLKVLFTGDHLAMTASGLDIHDQYNQYSVPLQLKSVELLLHYDFLWMLPGHGRRIQFKNVEDKNSSIETYLATRGHKLASLQM